MMRKVLLFGSAMLALFVASSSQAAQDTITATATTQAAMTVSCSNLNFGTLGIEATNAETTISVDASSGAVTSSSPSDVYVASQTGGRATCDVSGEDGQNDATVALSAADATYSSPTLSGLDFGDGATSLADAGTATLSAVSTVGNGTAVFGIGGTLTLPASFASSHDYGAFTSQAITVTVTD